MEFEMEIWLIVTIALYVINGLTILTLMFVEKKNVANTIAWILVITFIPVLGFLLYFFLGSTSKIKIMAKKYSLKNIEKEYNNVLEETKKRVELHHENNFYKDVIFFNINNSSIYTENNNVTLYKSAKDKYKSLFDDIENAKKTINLEYFIIKSKDDIGKKLIALLAKKAKEGVEVRVIYDRFGVFKTRYSDFKEIIKNGGKVQRYLPSLFKTFTAANYRLHRKIVVIDSKIAYTGGINIGDDYLGLDKKIKPWRDTAIKIIGDAVSVLQYRFILDWNFLLKQNRKLKEDDILKVLEDVEETKEQNDVGIQILSSGPDDDKKTIRDAYIKIISNAENYVYIQTPYLVPDDTLFDTIRIAKESGIDVRIIMPGIPDKKFVYNISLIYAEEFLKCGVKVYLHEGFIHAKSIVADDYITSIGTCNMDTRSFIINYENTAIIYDGEFANMNKQVFMEDIIDSKEVNLEYFKKKGIWFRIKQGIFRFLAPLV